MRDTRTGTVITIVLVLTLIFLSYMTLFPPATQPVPKTANSNVAPYSSQSYGLVSSPSFGPLYSASVNATPGYMTYIYVGTGGGDHPINTSSFKIAVAVDNSCSDNGSIIGFSHLDNASIQTRDIDYSTSGIGVNLPVASYYTFQNDHRGAHSIYGNFTLNHSSLVVLASAGTNEGYPTINGALGHVSSSTLWGDLGILFSYAVLEPGSYNFSINYQLWGNCSDYASSTGAVLFLFNESGTIYQYVSTPCFGPLYSNSAYLPTGYLNYIYVATGGGDNPMQNPSFNVSLYTDNHCSSDGSIIGYSHSNIGTMQTKDIDYSISGIGVNLPMTSFKSYQNDSNGSHALNGSFSLSSRSLVVLASAGTNEGYASVNGSIGNSSSRTPWGDLGASFSYALLGPGNYNFSINYQLWGNSTDYASSTGAVIYVFNISANVYQISFTESGLPLSLYTWYVNIGEANYTTHTNTIIASLLPGQYSYAIGVGYFGPSPKTPIHYISSQGKVTVPSSKMNYTWNYTNTVSSRSDIFDSLQSLLTFANPVLSIIVAAIIGGMVVATVLMDDMRKKRQ